LPPRSTAVRSAPSSDICRDFGILLNHPLWRELQKAIMDHGGSYVRLLKDILTPPFLLSAEDVAAGPAALLPSLTPACTGHPELGAASSTVNRMTT
jgi:hypothetical protein